MKTKSRAPLRFSLISSFSLLFFPSPMPFLSGRVSYTRLRVSGDAPAEVDDAFLGILSDHAFVESPAPRVGVLESGFASADFASLAAG